MTVQDTSSERPKDLQDKRLVADVGEQFIDSAMGPFMDLVMKSIPDKTFHDPRFRKLFQSSTWLLPLVSVAIARIGKAPQVVDLIRTRAAAEWTDQVNQRLKGETSEGTAPLNKESKEALRPILYATQNLFFFLMRLDDQQWGDWLKSIEGLDSEQQKSLVNMFAGLKPNQVEKMVQRFSGRGKGKVEASWPTLFQIFKEMGMLPEPGKEKVMTPEERTNNILQRIISMESDEGDKLRSFVDFLSRHLSSEERQNAMSQLFDWDEEALKRLANEFPSHEDRLTYLSGLAVDHRTAEQVVAGVVGELVSPVNKAVKELAKNLRERAKADRERGATLTEEANQRFARTKRFKSVQFPTPKSVKGE